MSEENYPQPTDDTLAQYQSYLKQAPSDQVAAAHAAALSEMPPSKQRSILGRFRDELSESGQAFIHGSTGTGPEPGGHPGGIGHYFDSFLHGDTGTGPAEGGEQRNPIGKIFDSFLHGNTGTHWHDSKKVDQAGQALGTAAQQAEHAQPGILSRIFGRRDDDDDDTHNEFMGRVLDHASRQNDIQE